MNIYRCLIRSFAFLVLLILSSASFAQMITVSGELSRPANSDISQSNFVDVIVSLVDGNGIAIESSSAFLFLESGAQSVSYSIAISQSSSADYRIEYRCFCFDFVEEGYFNSSGTVAEVENAELLSLQQLFEPINFSILAPVSVTGTLSRPLAIDASESVFATVRATQLDSSGNFINSFEDFVNFSENELSRNFFLDLPPITSGSFRLEYSCANCRGQGIVAFGFFNSSGTTLNVGEAQLLSLADISTPLNFEMVEADTISGVLSRPLGVDASQLISANVSVTYFDEDERVIDISSDSIVIASGQLNGNYSVDVIPTDSTFFVIRYSCFNCPGIVGEGYFNSNGTALNLDDAERLTDIDVASPVDFTMIRALSLSGSLSRPTGVDASQAISPQVVVTQLDEDGGFVNSFSQFIFMDSDQVSADYAIDIPPIVTGSFRLEYSCFFCPGIVETGFFNTIETAQTIDGAQLLSSADIASPIAFEMIEAIVISGTLSRPVGADSSEPIFPRLEISQLDENGDFVRRFSASVSISSNSLIGDFAIDVPPTTSGSFRLEYSCFSCPGIVETGYFNTTGTALTIDGAELLSSSDVALPIAFEMIEAIVVSVILSRPAGADNSQFISPRVEILQFDEQGTVLDSFSRFVSIPSSLTSGSFEIELPPINSGSFQIEYQCSDCAEIVSNGYFNINGSVLNEDDAQPLTAAEIALPINFIMIRALTVSGSLLRPIAADASQELFPEVQVTQFDQNGNFVRSFIQSISIDIGELSADYAIDVPPITSGSFRLEYSCGSCPGIVEGGFLGSSGSVLNEDDARQFLPTDLLLPINFSMIQSLTVSGAISRPSTVDVSVAIAPQITISRLDSDGVPIRNFTETVTIAANETSVNYVIDVPPDASSVYRISYSCDGCVGVIDRGFFNSNGAVLLEEDAQLLSFSELALAIDLLMIQAISVSGTVSRPQGADSSQAIFPQIEIVERNGDGVFTDSFSSRVTIEAGQLSANYTVEVPPIASGGFILGYTCFSCPGIVDRGSYTSNGTVREFGEILAPGTVSSPINFSMIGAITISGTVSRPLGTDISQGVTSRISVEQINSNGSFVGGFSNETVSFAPGAVSAEYSIEVPPLSLDSYRISYSCFDCSGIVEQGYVNSSGTVFDIGQAQLLSLADVSQAINFSMIEAITLTGTLSRPPGADASTNIFPSVSVDLIGVEGVFVNSFNEFITIAADETSASFSIDLPPISSGSFRLSYNCGGCPGTVNFGFFNSTGSTVNASASQLLLPDDIDSSINFTMIDSIVLEGALSRPSGVDAQETIFASLVVAILDSNGNLMSEVFNNNVIINSGSLSTNYSIELPPIDSGAYTIRYRCFDCPGILESGFYNSLGTAVNNDDAELLQQADIGLPINFAMIETATISGVISLPQGVETTRFIQPEIEVTQLNEIGEVVNRFFAPLLQIAPQEDETDFSVNVPILDVGSYRVSYNCFDCTGIVETGFYNSTGSSANLDDAQLLSQADISQPINFTMVEGMLLSGTLSRPLGQAPSEPILARVELVQLDLNGNFINIFSANASIDSDQMQGEFLINIPAETNDNFRLEYRCFTFCEGQGVVASGFFNSTGSVVDSADAQLLSFADLLSPIDFVVLELVGVSGTLLRPEGSDASQTILARLTVMAFDDQDNDLQFVNSQGVVIAAGESETNFSVDVPPFTSGNFRLEYDCEQCPGILAEGFFNATGSSVNSDGAQVLSVSELFSPINFPMIGAVTFSGSVSRPAGAQIDQSIFPELLFSQLDNEGNVVATASSGFLFLADNEASVDYTVDLQPLLSGSYRIEYNCVECQDIIEVGYFNSNGTVSDIAQAQLIDVNDGPFDIDIEVLLIDEDGDLVTDRVDNCIDTENPDQRDLDSDGLGDVCDSDADGDNVLVGLDADDLDPMFCGLDVDGDGCDDCLSGVNDTVADGDDLDGDGVCDIPSEEEAFCLPILAKNGNISVVCF